MCFAADCNVAESCASVILFLEKPRQKRLKKHSGWESCFLRKFSFADAMCQCLWSPRILVLLQGLIRAYQPYISLYKALLNPDFWGYFFLVGGVGWPVMILHLQQYLLEFQTRSIMRSAACTHFLNIHVRYVLLFGDWSHGLFFVTDNLRNSNFATVPLRMYPPSCTHGIIAKLHYKPQTFFLECIHLDIWICTP